MPGYPWQKVRDPQSIPPGSLRNQIQLQAQSTTQTASGAPSTSWTTFLTTFAAIATVSSREVYQAQQFVSQVTHRITIRWPGSSIVVEQGQRVLFGAKFYTVQAVENVEERNRVLRLMCLEIEGSE